MIFRNVLIASSLLVASGSALSETQPLMFQVEAEVRADAFMILPQGDWHLSPTKLTWRPDMDLLEPVTKTIHVKSSLGEVSAYLDVAPELRSGVNNIPMEVRIGHAELKVGSANKVSIAAAPAASAGVNLPLQIAAPQPDGGYKPGYYSSVVNMTFESVAP